MKRLNVHIKNNFYRVYPCFVSSNVSDDSMGVVIHLKTKEVAYG